MSFRGKLWVLGLSGVIAAYAVIGGLPLASNLLTTSAQEPANDSTAQLRIVESVLQHIQNDYVDDPNMDKVRVGALRGLAGGLDPYSSFLTADQVRNFETNKGSNRVGIGAEFSQISRYLYIISAVKGSPADKAGLKAGDVIEYVDNKATQDISLYDAQQMIAGDAGTTVSLRVLRSGEKPQTIKVVRGAYKAPSAESRVEAGRVGVIKIHSLETGQANEVRTQLANLQKQGVQKIILDLRGVAAGPLTEAVAVSNLFINSGELGKVIGKDNKVLNSYSADPSKAMFDGGLAVLVDFGTAGAGEAVAAAIMDHKRGEVIGEKTFGAGTEQKLFTLRGGDGLLLTIAKWAGPNGKPFLGDDRATMGLKPTVEVKRPDTPEPLEVENLIDQNNDQNQNPQPQASPTPKPAPKPVEDLQLKKALEVLVGRVAGA
jgi:carboxyl-terminal processing protease